MRPRRLRVEAVGPFASEVEVDFDGLADAGLFLIHGPTGAGKTSLLDAVCFALYGRVPGNRGGARSVRSHHAARGVEPRAELDFDVDGARYRVIRTAAWEAPKLRGTGTTPKPPTAVLRRLDAGHEAVLAAKPTEVDREVERLVGLDANQFQQVILLPQGRFERLLQAGSAEREKLFESLFDTSDHRRAAEWLDEQAREARRREAELRQQLAVIGDEALRRSRDVLERPVPAPEVGGGAGGGLAVLDRSAVAELVDADPLDPATLDLAVVQLTEAVEAAAAVARDAAAAAEAARVELDRAGAVVEQVERRDRLRATATSLEARSAEVARERTTLARAVEAEALRATLDDVEHRTRVVERTAAAVDADLAAARAAVEDLLVPVEAVEALDLRSLPDARALGRAIAELQARRGVLAGLAATAERAAAADRRIEATTKALNAAVATGDAARLRLSRAQADLPERRERLDAARTAAGRLAGLERAATEAATRAEAAQALGRLRPRLGAARAATLAAREHAASAKEAHLDALRRYLDGIAAHLAGRLELDAPCAVCGSHDHPDPARPAPDAVTEDEVERLDLAAREAQADAEERAEAERHLDQEVAALDAAAGPAAADPGQAAREAERCRAEHRRTAALAAEAEARAAAVDAAEAALERERAAIAEADGAATAAREQLGALEEKVRDARAALAEHLPVGVTLDAALDAVDAAEPALGRVADHAAGGQEAAAKLAAATERAQAEVAASPFRSAAAARSAMLDAAERDARQQRIAEHERRQAEVAARLDDPAFAALPDVAPDLAPLRAAHAAADAARARAAETVTLAASARDAVAGLAARHRGVAAELAEAEAEATLRSGVADRCTGRTAPKVPLQRWVLATHLDEVCQHANRRLATMTSGRYRLLVTRVGARANSPAGLDLRVHDANTNQEREVSTLSGGETFQASLALALGVADSVQARTGGVRLDALFIDEGFGTLDPDALELAMDELDTLRAGGRTVGVISHVAGLKERITTGIEVVPSEHGSQVIVGTVT